MSLAEFNILVVGTLGSNRAHLITKVLRVLFLYARTSGGGVILVCSELMGHFFHALVATEFFVQALKVFERTYWLPAGPVIGALATWHTWLRSAPGRDTKTQSARHAVIVGAGEHGQSLARHLNKHKQLGYIVKGYVDHDHDTDHPHILGRPDELIQIATKHFIDEVFIAMPPEQQLIDGILSQARKARFSVKLVQQFAPDLSENENVRIYRHSSDSSPTQ